jgi:hypothetical protein
VARLCALAGETSDDEEDSDSEEDDDAEPVEWYDKGTTRLPRKASEWAQEQAQDVDLRVLRGWLQHGQVPPKAERRALPPRLRCLADRVGKLQIGPMGSSTRNHTGANKDLSSPSIWRWHSSGNATNL